MTYSQLISRSFLLAIMLGFIFYAMLIGFTEKLFTALKVDLVTILPMLNIGFGLYLLFKAALVYSSFKTNKKVEVITGSFVIILIIMATLFLNFSPRLDRTIKFPASATRSN